MIQRVGQDTQKHVTPDCRQDRGRPPLTDTDTSTPTWPPEFPTVQTENKADSIITKEAQNIAKIL